MVILSPFFRGWKSRMTDSSAGAGTAPPGPYASMAKDVTILDVGVNPSKPDIYLHGNAWVAGGLCLCALVAIVARAWGSRGYKALEIDEAEIGIGSGKIRLRPNYTDRQVAYQIWVELSTRKLGLKIDLDHDVIVDIYDSWHDFFGITRDLIKSIPVSRASDESTRKIIRLSIEVLNEGLRPHLTRWQARFRAWYDQQLQAPAAEYEDPQAIQKRFGQYDALKADLLDVNNRLIAYRSAMRRLYGPQ
jgi:hypothetical protein